jgi:hypothetical protein
MEIQEALEQLDEIHHQVSRSSHYRGYRSVLTALVGGLALLAALLQPRWVHEGEPLTFVFFWVGVAALGAALPLGHILYHYLAHEGALERRKTRLVVGQFLPCVFAGAFLTISICQLNESMIVVLPGLWSILFALGIYASKPYLPNAIQWMAGSFFLGGILLLSLIPSGSSLSPWGMGLDFGLGMFLGALVLRLNIERNGHEKQN